MNIILNNYLFVYNGVVWQDKELYNYMLDLQNKECPAADVFDDAVVTAEKIASKWSESERGWYEEQLEDHIASSPIIENKRLEVIFIADEILECVHVLKKVKND